MARPVVPSPTFVLVPDVRISAATTTTLRFVQGVDDEQNSVFHVWPENHYVEIDPIAITWDGLEKHWLASAQRGHSARPVFFGKTPKEAFVRACAFYWEGKDILQIK